MVKKDILVVHYDGGDVVGHYEYDYFETISDAFSFIFDNKIKSYTMYKLIGEKQ